MKILFTLNFAPKKKEDELLAHKYSSIIYFMKHNQIFLNFRKMFYTIFHSSFDLKYSFYSSF